MSAAQTPWLAVAALVFNAFVWGVSWIAFRELDHLGLHALWATALVFGVAVLVIAVKWPKAWREVVRHPGLWLLFVSSGVSNVGFNWAVTIGDVVRVALLFYTMPAWAVLLSWLMWGERPSLSRIAQVTLALAGVVVVLKSPDSPWPVPQSLADYLALLAGFAFAVTNLMMRHMRHTATSARMLAMFGGGAGMAALAAVCATGIGMISAVPAPQLSWWVWILALCVAMLGGNMAFQYGAARLSAVTGSLIMLTEVLFATASSLWLGATHAELRTWIGGAMILAAAALAARGESANAGESAGETESARGPVSQ